MQYTLNIYADCATDKPVKSYEFKRLTYRAATELGALQAQAKDDKDGRDTLAKMLKIVFPDFDEADLDGVDLIEVGQFFKRLGALINGTIATAEKN